MKVAFPHLKKSCPLKRASEVCKSAFKCCLSIPLLVIAGNASAAQEKIRLAPIHSEIPPTLWEQYGWWLVAGGAAVLGLIIAVVLWVRRPRPLVIVPIEIQTRKELEALQARPEDGNTLSLISRCLRRYLVVAFEFPDGELTTAELKRLMEANPNIGSQLATQLSDFFCRCDELKFAPTPVASAGTAQRALELLENAERRRAESRAAQSSRDQ